MIDTRPMWQWVFGHNWPVAQRLVGFYLSLDCSSCQLESDLGKVSKLTKSYGGARQKRCRDIERAPEFLLDGPQTESELFERTVLQAECVLGLGLRLGSRWPGGVAIKSQPNWQTLNPDPKSLNFRCLCMFELL